MFGKVHKQAQSCETHAAGAQAENYETNACGAQAQNCETNAAGSQVEVGTHTGKHLG